MSTDAHNHGPHLPDGLLLEGVVTTLHADGSPHVAPMGPIVNNDFTQIRLRPFRSSTTYQNLGRSRQGVLHVTDDVELIARAAVGELHEVPPWIAAREVNGVVLRDACRWYEFRVASIDDRDDRTEIVADIVACGRGREFFGFNRAKHVVIEAAIVATRLHLLEPAFVQREFARMATVVEKTGGSAERRAFQFLCDYVDRRRTPEATE
ncbi:MAG: DUF447 family protein [Pirellulales bacterium]